MKPVGKPDAGNPHVRFDERGRETGWCRMAQATAPVLDSTVSSTQGGGDLLPRGNAVSVVAVGALPLIPRIGGGGNKRGHESGRHGSSAGGSESVMPRVVRLHE